MPLRCVTGTIPADPGREVGPGGSYNLAIEFWRLLWM